MDFEVVKPLRILTQSKPDECTSCALASIAEDVVKAPVDPLYIYGNSADGQFGITPNMAVSGVLSKGVLLEGVNIPVFPFKTERCSLPWIFQFDSIIRMMRRNNRSVFAGCYWQSEWDVATDGVMKVPAQWNTWFAHAFKIFGVKQINGIMYLMVQNSFGSQKGDGGIWYMPREIASRLNFAIQLL